MCMYDMVWYGMEWYGMVWYGLYVCMQAYSHNLTESGPELLYPSILYLYQRATSWYGASLQHNIIWHDMTIVGRVCMHGMVQYNMLWYGMVWYGMVCM